MQIRKALSLLGVAAVMSAFLVTDRNIASANHTGLSRRVRLCLSMHSPVRFLDESREERMRHRRLLRQCIRAAIFGVDVGSSSSRSSMSSSSQSSVSSSSLSSVSSSRSSSLSSSSVSSGPSSSSVSSSIGSSPSSSSISSSSQSSAGTTQATAAVNITNFAFSPGSITVTRGTRITWTNNDTAPHTVTRDGSSGPYSSVLTEGESYSRTFNAVGTFPYHCAIHPEMTGMVTVTP